MLTPPISTTRPLGRTVVIAARTTVVETEGGMMSNAQSMGPGAARFISSRSSFSLPVSFTGLTRAPWRGLCLADFAEPRHVLGRHPHLLGKGTVVKILLQSHAAFAARAHALQVNVGSDRVVARANRRIADDPVADGQFGCVRANRA